MRDQTWSNLVVLVVVISVVVAVPALVAVVPAVPTPDRGVGTPSSPTVFCNLSIVRGLSGDYIYNQTQLTVPADMVVVFTITNYDPAVSLLPTPNSSKVAGTLNGAMIVSSGNATASVQAVSTSDVSHTFTMSDVYYHLNVPIPPAHSSGVPTRVTFSVMFHFPGQNFSWGCVAYCGGPLMAGMYGTLTVR